METLLRDTATALSIPMDKGHADEPERVKRTWTWIGIRATIALLQCAKPEQLCRILREGPRGIPQSVLDMIDDMEHVSKLAGLQSPNYKKHRRQYVPLSKNAVSVCKMLKLHKHLPRILDALCALPADVTDNRTSPCVSPRASPCASPRASPHASPRASPSQSPPSTPPFLPSAGLHASCAGSDHAGSKDAEPTPAAPGPEALDLNCSQVHAFPSDQWTPVKAGVVTAPIPPPSPPGVPTIKRKRKRTCVPRGTAQDSGMPTISTCSRLSPTPGPLQSPHDLSCDSHHLAQIPQCGDPTWNLMWNFASLAEVARTLGLCPNRPALPIIPSAVPAGHARQVRAVPALLPGVRPLATRVS